MTENTVQFPYKPKLWMMVLAALFFAALCWFMVQTAIDNDRGIRLFRVITLSVRDATWFYWIMAVVSASLCVLGGLGCWRAMTSRQQIILTDTAVIGPKRSYSGHSVEIPFDTILDLEQLRVSRQDFLHIHHTGGKMTLARTNFATRADFEACISTLVERITALDHLADGPVQPQE